MFFFQTDGQTHFQLKTIQTSQNNMKKTHKKMTATLPQVRKARDWEPGTASCQSTQSKLWNNSVRNQRIHRDWDTYCEKHNSRQWSSWQNVRSNAKRRIAWNHKRNIAKKCTRTKQAKGKQKTHHQTNRHLQQIRRLKEKKQT